MSDQRKKLASEEESKTTKGLRGLSVGIKKNREDSKKTGSGKLEDGAKDLAKSLAERKKKKKKQEADAKLKEASEKDKGPSMLKTLSGGLIG